MQGNGESFVKWESEVRGLGARKNWRLSRLCRKKQARRHLMLLSTDSLDHHDDSSVEADIRNQNE
jgi:hypothetical protein